MISSSNSQDGSTLWLIAHERDDPHRLTMHEHRSSDVFDQLEQALQAHRDNGARVDPREIARERDIRYQVFDDAGWLATYWISAEAPANEGMLTAIATPGSPRKDHSRTSLH